MNQHFIPSLIVQLFFLGLVALCVTVRVAVRENSPPAVVADCEDISDTLPEEALALVIRP